MPDRYRSAVRATVALGFVLLGAAAVIIPALMGLDDRSHERADARRAYSDYPEVREYCARDGVLPGPQMTTCLIERAKAQYEQEANHADLRAQQEVAVWTGGVFGLGLIGYFISILGIVFLYANLRMLHEQIDSDREAAKKAAGAVNDQLVEMRKANVVAETNMRAQVRAYLSIQTVNIQLVEFTSGPASRLRIHGTIRNSGQSPARELSVWAHCTYGDDRAFLDDTHQVEIDDISPQTDGAFELFIPCAAGREVLQNDRESTAIASISVNGRDVFDLPFSNHANFHVQWANGANRYLDRPMERSSSRDLTGFAQGQE